MKKILLSLSCVAFLYASQAEAMDYEAATLRLADKLPESIKRSAGGRIETIVRVVNGELQGLATKSKAGLHRVSSEQSLLSGRPEGGKRRDYKKAKDDYQAFMKKFCSDNGMFPMAEAFMLEMPPYAIQELKRLLGSEKKRIGSGDGAVEAEIIDLSWPNIRRAFARFDGTRRPRGDLLRMIAYLTKDHSQDGQLEDDLAELIVKLCFDGDDSLFDLTSGGEIAQRGGGKVGVAGLDAQQIGMLKQRVKAQLGNFSFFQRIMSTLAAREMMQRAHRIIVCNGPSIGERMELYVAGDKIVTRPEYWNGQSGRDYFYHEVGHQFHKMILGRWEYPWYDEFSAVFGSLRNDDLTRTYLPSLARSMLCAVDIEVGNLINDEAFRALVAAEEETPLGG